MDRVTQALYAAEYRKLVLNESQAMEDLEQQLRPLFKAHYLRMDVPAVQRRVKALKELPANPSPDSHYIATFGVRGVVRYALSNGLAIFRVPVFSFAMSDWKDHWTSTYLVQGKHSLTLVDTGTHLSEESLRQGIQVVREFFKVPVSLEQVDHVLITHAHFDHFGGLGFVLPASGARLYIHEWDAATLTHYAKEVAQGRERILRFMHQSGMPEPEIQNLMKMHGEPKRNILGFPVYHAFGDGEHIIEDFEIIHTPGHCPGLSCIRVGDVILLGDHVLNTVTPHQFPKIYTSGSGLLNYMNSLLKIMVHSENARLGLPSHYGDVPNIERRALEILTEHQERIAGLLKTLDVPKSLYQLTADYFQYQRGRELTGYEQLLALEEIGAHVEYMEETLGVVAADSTHAIAPNGEHVLFYRRK
jgi:glyoxylase-like metal-dependent hydrolase (beta-lactamase superfamily II)